MISSSLALGLLAALIYGSADMAGGLASRRSPAVSVLAGAYLVSLPLMLVGALVEGIEPPAHGQLAWALVGGGAEAIATLCLYAALASGTMSLVSPCVSLLGASIPLVIALALGERLPGSQALGIVLALAAVVAVAGPTIADRASRRSLLLALASGLAYAVSFVAFSQAETTVGAAGAGSWELALVSRLVGLGTVLALVRIAGQPVIAAAADRPFVALAGLLDATALTCLLAAYGSGPLGLTTVVASLYPAVTVVLAAVLLRERIGRLETAGVGLALVAIVLVGLA